ncbi:MAG: hypothetical protein Q8M15_03785 [Bacteroidota bacterium]|nr:hypothetical protein [Bacteroidota bacterium]
MFIGHFGVGFAAKKLAPAISLGYLFIASQFLDLLWPTLLLFDIEHVIITPGITRVTPLDFIDYPYSHSLLMVCGWGILLGLLTWLLVKNFKYSMIIFLCVLSHWFLDLIVHRPDLPLLPGDTSRFGFGLWNYPLITALLELIFFLSGVYFYYKTTTSNNNIGKYALIVLIGLLILIQIMNMIGPPPPGINAIAWAGQLQWLFVLMAFWVDRHRIIK